jgi:tetratricopeptide (TPR) repeat protein
MKKLFLLLVALIMFFSSVAFAGEWDDLMRDALKQAPSRSKRRTRSGQRLLREKRDRIHVIDRQVPLLMRRGDYREAEGLLKEALKLTIEFYNTTHNLDVAERFVSLGIVYMEEGDQAKAEETFLWALKIGEPILGQGSYRLANVYKFLAIAYYEQGKYRQAAQKAEILLSAYISEFGRDDPRTEEAKELLKKIYEKERSR